MRKFKNRNNRSAAGAYEEDARGRRGFGPLDPDDAWDARVGHDADSYGYHEDDDIETGRGRGRGDNSYHMNVPTTTTTIIAGVGARGFDHEEEDRGRRASRSPMSGPGGRNPFDDDAGMDLRGVSPRPIDTSVGGGGKQQRARGEPESAGSSPTERRSVFRENM